MFELNPCRRNSFDVFPIDRSETNLKTVLEKIKDSRELWKFKEGKLTARDGSAFEVDEAQLHTFEARMRDPLLRLQDEQFVHQAHRFAEDVELKAAAEELGVSSAEDWILGDAREAVESVLAGFVPEMNPAPMEDSLPWPTLPGPSPVQWETLDKTILRDA